MRLFTNQQQEVLEYGVLGEKIWAEMAELSLKKNITCRLNGWTVGWVFLVWGNFKLFFLTLLSLKKLW
jgi:hypothetical protein